MERWDVTYLPVASDGIIDVKSFQEVLRPETVFASMMLVNNEIGTVQPVEEIGRICQEKAILFHVDAAQAVGKMNVHARQWNIDALSVSAHKFHGPKGIGALAVSRKMESLIKQNPLIVGGGQERGLRSGTVPVPLAVGFGQAAQLVNLSAQTRSRELGQRLFHGIQQGCAGISLNGSSKKRLWSNVSISIPDLEAGALLQRLLPHVSCSSSSACSRASRARFGSFL